jgi:hypothetical protein
VFRIGWQEDEKRLFVELRTLFNRASPLIVVAAIFSEYGVGLVKIREELGAEPRINKAVSRSTGGLGSRPGSLELSACSGSSLGLEEFSCDYARIKEEEDVSRFLGVDNEWGARRRSVRHALV